jgi:hypothetical protein
VDGNPGHKRYQREKLRLDLRTQHDAEIQACVSFACPRAAVSSTSRSLLTGNYAQAFRRAETSLVLRFRVCGIYGVVGKDGDVHIGRQSESI